MSYEASYADFGAIKLKFTQLRRILDDCPVKGDPKSCRREMCQDAKASAAVAST